MQGTGEKDHRLPRRWEYDTYETLPGSEYQQATSVPDESFGLIEGRRRLVVGLGVEEDRVASVPVDEVEGGPHQSPADASSSVVWMDRDPLQIPNTPSCSDDGEPCELLRITHGQEDRSRDSVECLLETELAEAPERLERVPVHPVGSLPWRSPRLFDEPFRRLDATRDLPSEEVELEMLLEPRLPPGAGGAGAQRRGKNRRRVPIEKPGGGLVEEGGSSPNESERSFGQVFVPRPGVCACPTVAKDDAPRP